MFSEFFARARWASKIMLTGVLWLGLASPAALARETAPEDVAQEEKLAALGAVTTGATIASIVADPTTALVSEGIAFTSNLALKAERASLTAPSDLQLSPNSTDNCSRDFVLPQTAVRYSNVFGLDFRAIPNNWGDLGAPSVLHLNSEVDVSVNHPRLMTLESQQTASFPAGRHQLEWTAATQIDPLFDVAVPFAMLAFNYSKLEARKLAAAREAKIQELQQSLGFFNRNIRWLGRKLSVLPEKCLDKCTIIAADFATEFERDGVSTSKFQQFTVFDENPPTVTLNQPVITLEATDVGGVLKERIRDQLFSSVTASDACDRPVSLGNDAPDLLPLGSSQITWTAQDLGPLNASGGFLTDVKVQTVIVEDTQAPLMVTPPGRVIEVDPAGANGAGLAPEQIDLGVPRVVDLADAMPTVSSNAPSFFPVDTRTTVVWSATDQSQNVATGTQLISVKTAGTNTAPTVADVSAATLTSQPVDIVLRGIDNDVLDGRVDPLSFRIPQRPEHGEFVAPLRPFFIEDYRTAIEGPYAEEFATTGNRGKFLFDNVCQVLTGPNNEKIVRDWVYAPRYVEVADDGTYFMIDSFWTCSSSSASTSPRISKWDRDGTYMGQINYSGTNDAFVRDDEGFITTIARSGSGGSSRRFLLSRFLPDFDNGTTSQRNTWEVSFTSTEDPARGIDDFLNAALLSSAHLDSQAGLLYINDRANVFVFDVSAELVNDVDDSVNPLQMRSRYLGALTGENPAVVGAGDKFLCTSGTYGSNYSGFSMRNDSDGNLYVTDSCTDRIHKFGPSSVGASGEFLRGEYAGWLGRCDSSTNNACDVDNQRSRGYTCTNQTCSGVSGGNEPGQFDEPVFLAMDPNDLLYVADEGRVQRFSPDGTFAGEAKSTGTGINQGERPGFVLGNLGEVKAVSVNATNFFVVDQAESFIHVFETTPLKDITASSATVSYVSDFNFHSGTDTFTYQASDGLADSAEGVVSIRVDRNFRPPEAFADTLAVSEDNSVEVTLSGDDPDGVIGTDDVFPLDTLTFRVVDGPRNGSIAGAGSVRTYTPNADFHGEDQFTFVTNDGRFDSEPATVSITVLPIDDAPRIKSFDLPARVGIGFPAVMQGSYSDDGASVPHTVTVNWGPVSETNGDFVDPDGDGDAEPRLEGIYVNEPPNRVGEGAVLGQHIYSSANPQQEVVFCMTDAAGTRCDSRLTSVEPLVNLDVELDADETPTAAAFIDVELSIENLQPQGSAGLVAAAVSLTQVASELEVDSIQSGNEHCSIVDTRLVCNKDALAPGEKITASLRVIASPQNNRIYDISEPFAVDVTTATDSVEDAYTVLRWLTFTVDSTDSDGDGMSDRFEEVFGLNPNSPTDADFDDDRDGLTNAEEFLNRSDPNLADTDNDQIPDKGDQCPSDPAGSIDTDFDGVCDAFHSDGIDSDGDGLTDLFEVTNLLDPMDTMDALKDPDGDGVSTLAETRAGSDPFDAESMPQAPVNPTLVSSVLPSSRSVQSGTQATGFATLINAGSANAVNCTIAPNTPLEGSFFYQTTNPATNAPTGMPNQSVDIASGGVQTFVFGITPASPLEPTDIQLRYGCDGGSPAAYQTGINTLLLSASVSPIPDIVALAATLSGDGVVRLDPMTGAAAFALATVNVGAAGTLTATPLASTDSLPISLAICQTDAATGQCINPAAPAASVALDITSNGTPTFSIFASSSASIDFSPAENRIRVVFTDASGVVRGSSSVAVARVPE